MSKKSAEMSLDNLGTELLKTAKIPPAVNQIEIHP